MTEDQILVRQCLDAFYDRCPKILPGVPSDMLAPDADLDAEWQKWKLLPSSVTIGELDAIDAQLPAPLPSTFRYYLSTYHILDMDFGQYKLPAMPSDGPLGFVKWRLMHTEMWPAGFMEFAGTGDGDPVCFDIHSGRNDKDYPIFVINHDAITTDGWAERTIVLDNAEKVADTFLHFLVMLCRPDKNDNRK
jgi:hypothetical protein